MGNTKSKRYRVVPSDEQNAEGKRRKEELLEHFRQKVTGKWERERKLDEKINSEFAARSKIPELLTNIQIQYDEKIVELTKIIGRKDIHPGYVTFDILDLEIIIYDVIKYPCDIDMNFPIKEDRCMEIYIHYPYELLKQKAEEKQKIYAEMKGASKDKGAGTEVMMIENGSAAENPATAFRKRLT